MPDLQHYSAFGDTPEEALAEILIARQAWLESAKELLNKITKPEYKLFF